MHDKYIMVGDIYYIYILGEKRRLLVFTGEKIDGDELEIDSFLMETSHHTGGACGHGSSIQFQRHLRE